MPAILTLNVLPKAAAIQIPALIRTSLWIAPGSSAQWNAGLVRWTADKVHASALIVDARLCSLEQ